MTSRASPGLILGLTAGVIGEVISGGVKIPGVVKSSAGFLIIGAKVKFSSSRSGSAALAGFEKSSAGFLIIGANAKFSSSRSGSAAVDIRPGAAFGSALT